MSTQRRAGRHSRHRRTPLLRSPSPLSTLLEVSPLQGGGGYRTPHPFPSSLRRSITVSRSPTRTCSNSPPWSFWSALMRTRTGPTASSSSTPIAAASISRKPPSTLCGSKCNDEVFSAAACAIALPADHAHLLFISGDAASAEATRSARHPPQSEISVRAFQNSVSFKSSFPLIRLNIRFVSRCITSFSARSLFGSDTPEVPGSYVSRPRIVNSNATFARNAFFASGAASSSSSTNANSLGLSSRVTSGPLLVVRLRPIRFRFRGGQQFADFDWACSTTFPGRPGPRRSRSRPTRADNSPRKPAPP